MEDLLAHDPNTAATSPPASAAAATARPHIDGPVLIVDVNRSRREQWRRSLAQSGVFAITTSSELKALELLGSGTAFRAAIVANTGSPGEHGRFIRQLANRRPDLEVLSIAADGGASDQDAG